MYIKIRVQWTINLGSSHMHELPYDNKQRTGKTFEDGKKKNKAII